MICFFLTLSSNFFTHLKRLFCPSLILKRVCILSPFPVTNTPFLFFLYGCPLFLWIDLPDPLPLFLLCLCLRITVSLLLYHTSFPFVHVYISICFCSLLTIVYLNSLLFPQLLYLFIFVSLTVFCLLISWRMVTTR